MDSICDILNAHAKQAAGADQPPARFVPATAQVIAGIDLTATGNQSYGSAYVTTQESPSFDRALLRRGKLATVGSTEAFPQCELRFRLASNAVEVAVFSLAGSALTRTLRCPVTDVQEYDEGLFTWLGPAEDVVTAWNDNDPAQCQVVTLDDLREFARTYAVRAMIDNAFEEMARDLHCTLPEQRHGDFDASCAELLPQEMRGWFVALMAAGANFNRRITPDPAAFCSIVSRNYEAPMTDMHNLGADATDQQLHDTAAKFLKAGYRSTDLATPIVKLYRHVRSWNS